jgi:hypothetical protein
MATRNLKRRANSIKEQALSDFDAATQAFEGSSGAGIFAAIQENAPNQLGECVNPLIESLATAEIINDGVHVKKVAIESQPTLEDRINLLEMKANEHQNANPKWEERIHLLEKKANVACPKCNDIAPQSYIEALIDVEQRTDCFEKPIRMSVNLARTIQEALVETTSLNLGKEAAIVLKVKNLCLISVNKILVVHVFN